MIIGVPKEIKQYEYRVGIVPAGVQLLVQRGHKVIVESKAGLAVGFPDEAYMQVGAQIVSTPEEVFEYSELIVKVKEPLPQEYSLIQAKHIMFTYLHLAADPKQAQALIDSNCIAVAYETVTDENNKLPLLAPMSEIAGRFSIQAGAGALEKQNGGSGILLGGVPGVEPARVVVIGGGVVGFNASRMAAGLNADITILDNNVETLARIDNLSNGRIKTLFSNAYTIHKSLAEADLIVGAVLIPGAAAPKLITRDMLKQMKPGSVLVDVSIDQGGCFETSKPTTHDKPTYIVDQIVHYCVANMPGAVARTATLALTNATLPFILELANQGVDKALHNNIHLRNGLNIYKGKVTHKAVAESLGYAFVEAKYFT